MTTNYFCRAISLALITFAVSSAVASGQVTFHVIASMSTFAQGQPSGVAEGSPGVFYSTAGSGSLISVTSKGVTKILESFPSGDNISSWAVSGPNGRFYSAVGKVPSLTAVFSVSASGDPTVYANQSVLPEFTQNLPDGALLGFGVNGNVVWSVDKATVDGVVTPVYQFQSTQQPGNVILANDGNYYGVFYSKTAPSVYAFRVTPSGAMTQLLEFPFTNLTGGYAFAPLLQATDGNLYGAMYSGGANGTGFIYKLTLTGQYTLLYSFPSGHYNPTSLIQASDGNLYGTTLALPGSSQIFKITTSGQYSTVYTMSNATLDGECTCLITQGSDGRFYGSAQGGGTYLEGLYFALDAGLPKPLPSAPYFTPQSGPAGTRVRIWGNNLLSASVSFNGTAGTSVSNSGPNYVWATVPAGAVSGPITVTTPGGTVTTTASFAVE
jgi:uncharacterized repeat protein (TIGR03803 family)